MDEQGKNKVQAEIDARTSARREVREMQSVNDLARRQVEALESIADSLEQFVKLMNWSLQSFLADRDLQDFLRK